MNNFYDHAGARIQELRKTNNWTREKFSEMAYISPKFLYEIEVGKKGFSAETLFYIAQALSVNCEYILTGNKSEINSDLLNQLNFFDKSNMNLISEILMLVYKMKQQTS